ncbi:MAG: pyridoxamine 5'-phosphate oxidase [Acidobacteriota bacterium]|nr:pyridoxamine 5'-phosphate oxidase [Acidobacteriota bacterium]MDH3524444.1 pyridoxamine 5'-phosphate oxidase [Acidobacteriota bacterium]
MDEGERQLLKSLLVERRLLALGVVVDDAPYVGQVPFALAPGGGALLIHVSRLAKHSRGLAPGAPWSGLLQLGDDGTGDPFQLPRLTLEGRVAVPERGGERHAAARAAYLARLPSGAMTFQLGDFTLYELAVAKGRLVAGFGSTFNIGPDHLRLLGEREAGSSESV